MVFANPTYGAHHQLLIEASMRTTHDVSIRLIWYHEAQSFQSFVLACRTHLRRLGDEDTAFGRWHARVPDGPTVALDANLDNLEDVLALICYDEADPGRYFAPDAAGALTPSLGALRGDSHSLTGFTASFVSSEYAEKASQGSMGKMVSTTVDGGSVLPGPNFVSLGIPFDRPELLEPAKVVKIVHALRQIWPTAAEGIVDGYGLRKAAHDGQPEPRVKAIRPGWITYLRVPHLARYLPDDIDRDDLQGDGVLIYACRELADAGNDAHIQRIRRISEVLEDLCLTQNEVLLHGWPDTANERRYRTQVTGAPADRVYRVALSDFSAWDGSRKVLIWTRLFEESNADTFDYKPTYLKPLACMPEVAEARKQLRSLALAGADCPIEWHIGRQELVEPLRVLLHEHAEVDPARLSVVYTPAAERPA